MIRVLYVDDESLLLDICKQFVEVPNELAIDTAISALEAENAMSRKDYDVIVSDYQMPGTDGIAFLRQIREKYGHIPFILFTGRGREEVAIEALNSGADFYLQKGGDPTVQYSQLKKAILQLAKSFRNEKSLTLSQRKYDDLVEGAQAIAIKLDPEMRITFVNNYGVQHLGWGDGLVGTNFGDWIEKARTSSKDDPRNIVTTMFAPRGKGETYIHSFRDREGLQHWVSWTSRFIRNARGTVEEVLLFGSDITDAKRYENELNRSHSLIKAAFDSSEEGILVTGMDRRITEYNQRFLEMWNVPPGAILLGERGSLLSHIADQLSPLDLFHSFMDDVYAHPNEEKRLTIDITDGRKFEAFTKPIMQATESEGRFWSFRDVTMQTNRERDFRVREADLLGLLENNKANMLLIDPVSGAIVYANRAACDFYGYECDCLLRMRISDLNTLEPKKVAEEMRLAQTEHKQYFIFQHRLANGEVRDVEVFSGPIQFEGRDLLFSLVHDISEMEQAKRTVEESELRHNRILNSLAVGILVSDAHGKLVYANTHIQDLLGRRSDEIVGLAPGDLVAEDQRETAVKNLASRSKGEQGTADYRFIRGNGTHIWVQVTAVPLFNHGVYGGTIASVVDISGRRHDAELLRESEKKFRDIFNNMHDAVIIHEPGGPFFEVNDIACERFGYTREEMLQMTPEDLDTPDIAGMIPDKMKQIMEGGSAIFESTHRTKDGRRIPTELNAILIGYRGKPAILVVCRDITERKISDERLARANEKLRILNSITRHDIMNQLMVLRGNLELAMTKEKDTELIKRLGKIGRSADMIKSQLLFAKDYQEIGTTTPQWQNIGQLLDQLPDLKEMADVEMDEKLHHLMVYADPMLGKVFHNILEDTVKYAETPLRVRIGCKVKKRSLVISYEDHGSGIPAGEKEKIFEMGFGLGTGLGLHLSREILSITDIKIVENGEAGKGVRFEIEVPEGKFRMERADPQ